MAFAIFIAVVAVIALRPRTAAADPGATVAAPNIQQLIENVAREYHQDPALMKAICRQESAFNPVAINENDPSYGLGQIMTFWCYYFGRVPQGDHAAAVRLLLNPRLNLEVQALILAYFRAKGFKFPEQADIYNVGETLWNRGIRNTPYCQAVNGFYRTYSGAH